MTPYYLPTSDLKVALVELRRPFTPAAVRFKVQSARRTSPQPGAKDYAIVITYIDARQAIERLNHVVGGDWSDQLTESTLNNGTAVAECTLTVLGVTRSDVGEASGLAQAKALRSDALKRAAVKFGVGVPVYAAPRILLKPANGLRATTVGRDNKPSWGLTEKAERHCRKLYTEWLKKTGRTAFGEPLDHGDLETSQGDWELNDDETDETPGNNSIATAAAALKATNHHSNGRLTQQQRESLDAAIDTAGLNYAAVGLLCASVGLHTLDELTQHTLPEFQELLTQEIASRAGARP